MPETQALLLAPGMFCWVELASGDPQSAKKFYGELFGWNFDDTDAGHGFTYTMIDAAGAGFGGMYPLMDMQREQGVPPHWLNYVMVEDCDESTERAQSLGGKLVMGPHDVMDKGRMSLLQDPTGAVFAIWETKEEGEAPTPMGPPNTPCWFELVTPDRDEACAFYAALLGWELEDFEGGNMEYKLFKIGETSVAGAMAPTPEMGEIPAHWMMYVHAPDVDAVVAKAQANGGQCVAGPMDIPQVGRMAVISDPSGAIFSAISFLDA